ncbi:hypothetical protein GCM10009745_75260 [Kribbella yunnanensis]|uniref:Neutral/alkaline non-lysosomal ceramidase N-terminal domain-containing protein n=1 Tax=Kribbella yunnanensis TaxID=190194 RepID=A0ABN2J130_9ACTN
MARFRRNAATLSVAMNTLNLTPKHPPWPSLWMGGYGWDPRGGDGTYARKLRAHCLVLGDSGSANVLLRIDVVSIPRDVHRELRRRVVEVEKLVADSDFLIASSHTHSGPMIGSTHPHPNVLMNLQPADITAVNQSTALFIDLMVDLVKRTVQAPKVPATLHYAEGSVRLGHNRTGVVDTVLPDVPVLLVRNATTTEPVAVLFGYACHPVCRGNDKIFDSDYVGVVIESIERRLGLPALFFQGLAGDIDPDAGGPLVVGEKLADAIVDVLAADRFTAVTGPILTKLTEIQLPFAVDTGDAAVQADLKRKFESRLDGHLGQAEVRHARLMLEQLRTGTVARSIPMPIQCWKFGGLTVLALSHEVLVGYQQLIKDIAVRLGIGKLWVMAYANETQCYIPTDETAWQPGYESSWREGDRLVAGFGSSMLAYSWPAPLRSSPVGTVPAAPGSAQAVVLAACEAILR